MPRDVIPFRTGPHRASRGPEVRPNVAFAALDLFRRLARTLEEARPFRDAARRFERESQRWDAPAPFFFADAAMGERPASRPVGLADRFTVPAARVRPHGAEAWAALAGLLDDAFTGCAADPSVRRAARAVPGLRERLSEFAADHRGCAEFAALLAVADDLALTVLHPAAGAGFRFELTGIADLNQLHVLLADATAGSPQRGYLAGQRPDAAIVDACLDQPADTVRNVATARFQFLRPEALRPDGTLPVGFTGSDYWLWGHESPANIPAVEGERVLLLADAVYPREWIVRRRFPALNAELRLLQVLDRTTIRAWLDRISGRYVESAVPARAA
jgi:hypothetical protein